MGSQTLGPKHKWDKHKWRHKWRDNGLITITLLNSTGSPITSLILTNYTQHKVIVNSTEYYAFKSSTYMFKWSDTSDDNTIPTISASEINFKVTTPTP